MSTPHTRGIVSLMLVFCATSLPALSQDEKPPLSRLVTVRPLDQIPELIAPAVDGAKEKAEDKKNVQFWPLRFASSADVDITPSSHGFWEAVPGGRLWRLRVRSKGATDINLGFTKFWLPEGATLHILAVEENYYQGPYTSGDNESHGQLWTPVIPGGTLVIELFVPEKADKEPALLLSRINRGYRDLFKRNPVLTTEESKSGSCNIMVNCPDADDWRDEIRSVARYSLNGVALCTGTLIMNARRDFRRYFLSADHCGINSGNAASLVVYWNYNSSGCDTQSGGSLAQNQSGAIFRASRADVDFALVELDDVPKAAFNVFYAGWERSGSVPVSGVGIHHPNTDTKAISFYNQPLSTIDSCIADTSQTHWNVNWFKGVTEPGSSGSAIWDAANHRIVGFLSGGASFCGSEDLTDCYGKFSVAWNGASPSSRLRDWLDPDNSGVSGVDGDNQSYRPTIVGSGAALVSESCRPRNRVIDPGETVTVRLNLQNLGSAATSNLVAVLRAGDGVMQSSTQRYGRISTGSSRARSFRFTVYGECGDVITPTLELMDGTNMLDDIVFPFRLGKVIPRLVESFDSVAAPMLPAGWSSEAEGAGYGWISSKARRFSSKNSMFSHGPDEIADSFLYSPPITISDNGGQLSFRQLYRLEKNYDGGVLEVSIDGADYLDVLDAGGVFLTGGYNLAVSSDFGSSIGGRQAWSGSSAQFSLTTLELPVSTYGKPVQFRWRLSSDEDIPSAGWYIDNFAISDQYSCCP